MSNETPPTVLIVTNELPLLPRYFPLLQTILADSAYQAYIHYAYMVRPLITKEVVYMLAESQYITRENLEFIAKDIGHLLVPLLEEMATQNSPTFQKILDARQQELHKDYLKQIRSDRIAQQKKDKQRILRYLRHRFGHLPDRLVQQVEATRDLDLLEMWLDQSLLASSLAEFEQYLAVLSADDE